jgi:hypothetical protein
MIKKFNEDWNTFEDLDNHSDDIKISPGEGWFDTYKKAKNLAISKNKTIKYTFCGLNHIITPYSDRDKLHKEFLKNIGKKGTKIEDKKEEQPQSHMQRWKEYWDKISRDVNAEMDTVSLFAKEHSISYEEAKERMSGSERLGETQPSKPVVFETGFEVVGLPSGQILYMNNKQIAYFKARNLICWKNTWKKPTTGDMIPIEVKGYCFEDKLLPQIKDQMDIIAW